MENDTQYGVEYGPPIQPGNVGGDGLGSPVTRQRGLAPTPQGGINPTPPQPIIQPGNGDLVTRNAGPHVTQRFGADGTLEADRRADANILFADHGLSDPEALPPGIERIAAPLTPTDVPTPGRVTGFGDMTAVQQRAAIKAQAEAMGFVVSDAPGVSPAQPPVVDVMQADQPGSGDPRDMSTGPQVISALPVIKKAPIVPVVLPTPKTRRVVAKAAPKAGKR